MIRQTDEEKMLRSKIGKVQNHVLIKDEKYVGETHDSDMAQLLIDLGKVDMVITTLDGNEHAFFCMNTTNGSVSFKCLITDVEIDDQDGSVYVYNEPLWWSETQEKHDLVSPERDPTDGILALMKKYLYKISDRIAPQLHKEIFEVEMTKDDYMPYAIRRVLESL